jgi:hypothetical protein
MSAPRWPRKLRLFEYTRTPFDSGQFVSDSGQFRCTRHRFADTLPTIVMQTTCGTENGMDRLREMEVFRARRAVADAPGKKKA